MIHIKAQNVISIKDGRKWEIRKVTDKYVLVRSEGSKTSFKIDISNFNNYVNDIDKIYNQKRGAAS